MGPGLRPGGSRGGDARRGRHGVPRRLGLQALHGHRADAARGARRGRPGRPGPDLSARVRPAQPVRRSDHAAPAHVAPQRARARAAGRALLRSCAAEPGADGREPFRDGARLRAGVAPQVLERRHRGRRLRPRAPGARALRGLRAARGAGADGARAERLPPRAPQRAPPRPGAHVELRRARVRGADLPAGHGAGRQPVLDRARPGAFPARGLRRRARAPRSGAPALDAGGDAPAPVRRRGGAHGFRARFLASASWRAARCTATAARSTASRRSSCS